jgi:superfamily I DNA/RNA helicase
VRFLKPVAVDLSRLRRTDSGKSESVSNHAPEERILLCAFNTRIARELQERLGGKWGGRAEAKTLHSLGFSFIRYAWGNHVQPDDNVELERVREAVGPSAPEGLNGLVLKLVSRAKNSNPFAQVEQLMQIAEDLFLVPNEEQQEAGWNVERLARAALAVMQASKVARPDGKISFDDMIYIPVACNITRAWYNMVVVDEAQDMNAAQLILAQRACKRGGRIVVVGDDRQAIYGFRGADSDSIDRLKAELNAVELPLTITYRCGKEIVAAAAKFVPDFQAAPAAPEGLVDSIEYDKLVEQARPGDFVISRKNAPLMSTCLRFLRAGIPARVEGRDVGRGLAARVKKIRAKSVPDFLKRLATWAEKEKARVKAKGKNVEEKIQVIEDEFETIAALADGAANVQEIVDRCFNLFEDSIDSKTSKPNLKPAVVCSSVHKAKGLEADRVFIMEDTLLRNRQNIEEKNIEYVAITRAKFHLTWVKGLPGGAK